MNLNFAVSRAESSNAKEEHYTELVNLHLDELYNFARYLTFDPEEAKDIVQQTFLSLYKNFNRLDLTQSPRPWLFKVTRNLCLDHLKKKKALHFSEVDDIQILNIPETMPGPEQETDNQLLTDRIKKNVELLPINLKEVVVLKCFEDLTFEQISEITGQPVNTVKTNFYRGKSRLYTLISN
jgi:RNA polymerase sigma-70 factor, ECF subfamily